MATKKQKIVQSSFVFGGDGGATKSDEIDRTDAKIDARQYSVAGWRHLLYSTLWAEHVPTLKSYHYVTVDNDDARRELLRAKYDRMVELVLKKDVKNGA